MPTGAMIGYLRVSTSRPVAGSPAARPGRGGLHPRLRRLLPGNTTDRPELAACLDYLRPGDTLVASLDRLFCSLADLIQIVGTLRRRRVGFKSLHEALGTTTPGGWSSTSSPRWRSSFAN